MGLQQTQQQLLELFASFKANQAPIPTPPGTVVIDEPVQEATPANVNILFAATFMICSETEAILRKGKERALMSSLELKLAYPIEVDAKPYPPEYKLSEF